MPTISVWKLPVSQRALFVPQDHLLITWDNKGAQKVRATIAEVRTQGALDSRHFTAHTGSQYRSRQVTTDRNGYKFRTHQPRTFCALIGHLLSLGHFQCALEHGQFSGSKIAGDPRNRNLCVGDGAQVVADGVVGRKHACGGCRAEQAAKDNCDAGRDNARNHFVKFGA